MTCAIRTEEDCLRPIWNSELGEKEVGYRSRKSYRPFFCSRAAIDRSAEKKRNTAKDPEAAVDKTPWKGDASEVSSNEGERNHSRAADQTERDDPLISYGIDVGTNERNCDNQVSKCQPVRAIREEGKLSVRDTYPLVDSFDPWEQVRGFSYRLQRGGVQDGN